MGEWSRRRVPTEEERVRVWGEWLDGHGVSVIQRHDPEDMPASTIRQILAEDPPETIRADLRHRLGGRFFWIASHGGGTGQGATPVIVRSPRAYTATAFRAAVRAIRRDVREAGGDVELGVMEGIEADVAVRLVNERGFRHYRFDETGAVERAERIEVPDLDEAPGPPGP